MIFDTFYEDLMPLYAYHYAFLHRNARIDEKDSDIIHITGPIYSGKITIYQTAKICELEIFEPKHGSSIFYLHFEIKSFKLIHHHFQVFFDYIFSGTSCPLPNVPIDITTNKQILLVCSGGISTNYIASRLQHISVDAVGLDRLNAVIDHYDVVLLAPQIAYHEAGLKRLYGDKVRAIDPLVFATCDEAKMIELANS